MNILLIGSTPEEFGQWKLDLPSPKIECMKTEEEFLEKFDSLVDGMYHSILVGPKVSKEFMVEAAQVCRNQCPKTRIYCLVAEKTNYFPKIAKKNGFDDSFLLPQDVKTMKEALIMAAGRDLQGLAFKKVKAMDLQPGSTLNFDTFLFFPHNNKYVRYSRANQEMEEKKVQKLKETKTNNLYIDTKEADAFFEYVASQLAVNSKDKNPLSETEREERVSQLTRNVFGELYSQDASSSFDDGAEVINMCQKVISSVITDGKDNQWFTKLNQSMSGLSDDYTHASETASFASLFAMIFGQVKIDDVGIAAYLHDVGLVDLPEADIDVPFEKMSEEGKKIYLEHPVKSLNLIKTKKMIISEKAERAIRDHHEKFNGKGFPKGFAGDRLPMEAQIVSLASQFQHLMKVIPGQAKKDPIEALKEIENNGSVSPSLTKKIIHALTSTKE